MAKSNSLTGATAPIPSHGGLPPVDRTPVASKVDELTIEGSVHAMDRLIDLVEWIDHARDFLSGIELRSSHDPQFAERVRTCDFAVAYTDWDDDTSEGMDYLRGVLREHLDTIGKASRGEVPAKRVAPRASQPVNIGTQLYNIHDVQALIESAMALSEGGGAIGRILSMANGRLDEICDGLDGLNLNSAGVPQ